MPEEPLGLCAELDAYSEPKFLRIADSVRSRLLPVEVVPELAEQKAVAGERPADPSPAPNVEWLRRVAGAILETTHSLRQVNQLRAIATPAVIDQINRRRTPHLRGRAVQVTSVRVSTVRRGVLEVGCTFGVAGSFYPMAFRMELTSDGWKMTACDIGPH